MLPDGTLDRLRTVADPLLEQAMARFPRPGLEDLEKFFETGNALPNDYVGECRAAVDELLAPKLSEGRLPLEDLLVTRDLFDRYGAEICGALLLCALPEAYACCWGSRVLAATGQLGSNLVRRIRATAQFLVDVSAPSGRIEGAWALPGKAGSAADAVAGLRVFHHLTRTLLIEKARRSKPFADILGSQNTGNCKPINQEDMIGTMLTFSVTVFEVLEKFGIAWTAEQQLAYLKTWNFIGACLGIGDHLGGAPRFVAPATVAGARDLMQEIRERQWPVVRSFEPTVTALGSGNGPVGRFQSDEPLDLVWDSLRPGRTLVKALLDELNSGMTRATRGLPLAVMQSLVPSVVERRLGLGCSGLALNVIRHLPGRRLQSGRFTSFPGPNRFTATTLHLMANEVTRRSIVAFVESDQGPPFRIPGLEDVTFGLRSRNAVSPRR